MDAYRRFKIDEERGVTIAQLRDRDLFDPLIVAALEDELLDFLDKQQPTKFLIDFEFVRHCSTAFINGLLRAKKRLLPRGGRLGLCTMIDPVREAYRMLNLDGTVFMIYEDRERGVNALSRIE
jgi:anti-anti-sigma regulatory factor